MSTFVVLILFGVSGPLFGIAALWLGCRVTSALGGFCGHNSLFTFIALMAIGWVAVAVLLAVLAGRKRS